MIKEVVSNIWRAAEADTIAALSKGGLDEFHSIICLRRTTPYYWNFWKKSETREFIHYPIPPYKDVACAQKVGEFVDFLIAEARLPALFFCKEGRNRTGMVAALIRYRYSNSLEDALEEYMRGVENIRQEEIAIIDRLCKNEREKQRFPDTISLGK